MRGDYAAIERLSDFGLRLSGDCARRFPMNKRLLFRLWSDFATLGRLSPDYERLSQATLRLSNDYERLSAACPATGWAALLCPDGGDTLGGWDRYRRRVVRRYADQGGAYAAASRRLVSAGRSGGQQIGGGWYRRQYSARARSDGGGKILFLLI